MQATNADLLNHKDRGDDDSIHFRPSPNFKHMKKYLKSKFEEANGASANGEVASTEVEVEERAPISVRKLPQQHPQPQPQPQPPLPPNPPPPHSPLQLTLKMEIEDEEYERCEDGLATFKPSGSDATRTDVEKNKTMCRQFARGICTRGASCIYEHELILSQLPGIYTFCKNFQNSGCKFPKCKFVHATVFEKEHFYRTGYLPPHAVEHLKESHALGPPPAHPPGVGGAAEETLPLYPHSPRPNSSSSGMVAVGCIGGAAEARPAAAAAAAAAAGLSPRAWGDYEGSVPLAVVPDEPLQSCKNCDVSETRLMHQKEEIAALKQSTEATKEKIVAITKKNAKLNSMILKLLMNRDNQMNLWKSWNGRTGKVHTTHDKYHAQGRNGRNDKAAEDNGRSLDTELLLRLLQASTTVTGSPESDQSP